MRTILLCTALTTSIGLAACGETTGSRSLSGAGIGAAGGAAVGAATGNTAMGAGIGAGAGLLGGYLYDQHKKGNID